MTNIVELMAELKKKQIDIKVANEVCALFGTKLGLLNGSGLLKPIAHALLAGMDVPAVTEVINSMGLIPGVAIAPDRIVFVESTVCSL